MSESNERWEKFLDPEFVKPSLFMATMFITTFEILRDAIVDRVKDFYAAEWSTEGATYSENYQEQVLDKNKSPVYASLMWLKEVDAINGSDLEAYEQLKRTRNLLAHQLFDVVTGQVESKHQEQFEMLVALLRKIEVWWVVNMEIPSNPDFDGEEIDVDGIVPGSILSLQMLLEVVSGNTELLEKWRHKRSNSHKS